MIYNKWKINPEIILNPSKTNLWWIRGTMDQLTHTHTHHKMHIAADDSTAGKLHHTPPQASMD